MKTFIKIKIRKRFYAHQIYAYWMIFIVEGFSCMDPSWFNIKVPTKPITEINFEHEKVASSHSSIDIDHKNDQRYRILAWERRFFTQLYWHWSQNRSETSISSMRKSLVQTALLTLITKTIRDIDFNATKSLVWTALLILKTQMWKNHNGTSLDSSCKRQFLKAARSTAPQKNKIIIEANILGIK